MNTRLVLRVVPMMVALAAGPTPIAGGHVFAPPRAIGRRGSPRWRRPQPQPFGATPSPHGGPATNYWPPELTFRLALGIVASPYVAGVRVAGIATQTCRRWRMSRQ